MLRLYRWQLLLSRFKIIYSIQTRQVCLNKSAVDPSLGHRYLYNWVYISFLFSIACAATAYCQLNVFFIT